MGAPRHVDDSMLRPMGASAVYCQALIDGAAKKGETVKVTKDVMMLKEAFKDEVFLAELHANINEPYMSALEKVNLFMKYSSKMESTVLPAFLKFLAKRQRLMSLNRILKEYVQRVYYNSSITPLKCYTSESLTDEQKAKICAKMKKRLGCDDVKLICIVDKSLLGGFKLEYNFTDPDTLTFCSDGQDCSLRGFLENAAISKGVIVEDI